MPHLATGERYEEGILLTRAIENLLRKLIRFLVGKVSLVKLQEMIRSIFIEEIEISLGKENPTKNIALTQLSLLSGLDTRTLIKIRNNPNFRKPFHKDTRFLSQFVVGASIINDWSTKAPYTDEKTGKPRSLKISGECPSFESLFKESIKSRGVRYKSLLRRLVANGIVSINSETGKACLVSNANLPSNSKDQLKAIDNGFSAITHLTETVCENICALESDGEQMFQREIRWDFSDKREVNDVRSELILLLKKTETEARDIINDNNQKYSATDSNKAGIGLFYFEEYP
jgi:hypothetical protein